MAKLCVLKNQLKVELQLNQNEDCRWDASRTVGRSSTPIMASKKEKLFEITTYVDHPRWAIEMGPCLRELKQAARSSFVASGSLRACPS